LCAALRVRERGGDLLDPAVAPLAASLPSLGSTPQKIRNAKSRAEVSAALNHYDGGSVAEYAEMVQSLDAAVGEVLTALRRSGQEEHTLGSTTGDATGKGHLYNLAEDLREQADRPGPTGAARRAQGRLGEDRPNPVALPGLCVLTGHMGDAGPGPDDRP
jgi:hypothetical protein